MTQETKNSIMCCYIGIGSNLDTPLQQVKTAIEELEQLAGDHWIGVSSLYLSAPLGPEGQDHYVNAVACFNTALDPELLLDQLQKIENRHKRIRSQRWGARTLDLDILLIADLYINSLRLQVPHPSICERNFVLVPLAELNSKLEINGTAISEHIDKCPAGSLHIL
jgi:2-amino-4-hydroxy-6-hydroxymethyldihydropteridine diphosphokinase